MRMKNRSFHLEKILSRCCQSRPFFTVAETTSSIKRCRLGLAAECSGLVAGEEKSEVEVGVESEETGEGERPGWKEEEEEF